jgi:hypothetical protein
MRGVYAAAREIASGKKFALLAADWPWSDLAGVDAPAFRTVLSEKSVKILISLHRLTLLK